MKKNIQPSSTSTPRGMTTHLPASALLRRHVQDTVLATFLKWGYREVIPPVFEYLDVLARGLSSSLLEKSYKFVDRDSGRLMLLRPDITPQVARMVAGILSDEPRPLRLCYYGNVFRYEESHAGLEREMFQAGCELAGAASPEADAEIIAVASESVRKFGIEDFRIVISHAGYLSGILSYLNQSVGGSLPHDVEHALRDAISKKDGCRIRVLLDESGTDPSVKNNVLEVLKLFGGEWVFDRAEGVIQDSESEEALRNLKRIYELLSVYGLKDRVSVDLCEMRGIDYYTGLFFEIFHEGVAYPLGRGGRYDNLIGRFGLDCPSTGFAIDVESIILAKEKMYGVLLPDESIKYLVFTGDESWDDGTRLSGFLRNAGHKVISDTGLETIEAAMDFAMNNNIENIITKGRDDKHCFVIDVKSGKKEHVDRGKLIDGA